MSAPNRPAVTSGETVPRPFVGRAGGAGGGGMEPGSGRRDAAGVASIVAAMAETEAGGVGVRTDGSGGASPRTGGAGTAAASANEPSAGVPSNGWSRAVIAAPTIVARVLSAWPPRSPPA